jgi:hypothetical protein
VINPGEKTVIADRAAGNAIAEYGDWIRPPGSGLSGFVGHWTTAPGRPASERLWEAWSTGSVPGREVVLRSVCFRAESCGVTAEHRERGIARLAAEQELQPRKVIPAGRGLEPALE